MFHKAINYSVQLIIDILLKIFFNLPQIDKVTANKLMIGSAILPPFDARDPVLLIVPSSSAKTRNMRQ